MANLSKLKKINESYTIYNYDNGFRFEASGRDDADEYKNVNLIINDEATLLEVIKEANAMERDD
tara:strand:+ start:36 stop:227 length:192 start_codon:yes stop_codon:yes gene_type:complete